MLVSLMPAALFPQTALHNKNRDIEIGYEITGELEGLKEGEKVTMHLVHGRGFI